jgi:Domain of unknown function (DUF397)
MSDMHEPPALFHRSTFCGAGGCVEVAAPSADEFIVRDAKDLSPNAPVLRFDRTEWDAFLSGVLAGEFHPTALTGRS